MKKILYTILMGAAVLSTSCSDYLNREPELYLTSEDIYSNVERTDGAVLGVYTQFKENSFIGGKAFACLANMGDEFANVSGNGVECTATYEMGVGQETSENTSTWNGGYRVINSANTALEEIEAHADVLGTSATKFTQELKFCRALAYFYLNVFYAKPYCVDSKALSVPLRLKAENSTEGNDLARSTNAEVYAQILEDTKDCSALPAQGATYDNITRASQAAVHMLRMRVYMAMDQWQNAISEGLQVKNYSLCDDVTAPFQSNSSCPESIFSIPYASTNNGGGFQGAAGYFFYDGGLVLDTDYGIMSNQYPEYYIVSDARVANLVNFDGKYSLTLKWKDHSTYCDWVPLMRYSETLLNLAECYYNNGDTDSAIAYLKQVRRRSIAAKDDPLNLDNLSGTALRDAIYLERRAEFVGEGIRAVDIKRRGENFVKGTSVTKPTDTGYTWPIPTGERANNSLITD